MDILSCSVSHGSLKSSSIELNKVMSFHGSGKVLEISYYYILFLACNVLCFNLYFVLGEDLFQELKKRKKETQMKYVVIKYAQAFCLLCKNFVGPDSLLHIIFLGGGRSLKIF